MRRCLLPALLLLLPLQAQAQEVAGDLLRGPIDGGQADAARRTRPPPAASAAPAAAAAPQPGIVGLPKGAAHVPVMAPGVHLPKPRELRPNPAVPAPVTPDAVAPGLSPLPLRPRLRGTLDDPYQPLGKRFGALQVFASNEVQFGYDDNTARTSGSADRRPSLFVRDAAALRLRSDWSGNQLNGDIAGGYSRYPNAPEADRPDLNARLGLRLDLSRDTQLDLETRARIDTQAPNSPDLAVATSSRPLIYQYGAGAGVTQRFNRLIVTARGAIDRTTYDNAEITGGATLDQSSRNLTDYALKLRTGYELHPGFIPFVEGVVDTRQYDSAVDASGFRRSSRGALARIGSTIEFSRLVTGEFAVGYGQRSYDDARLSTLRGPVADASITWAATPLTTLTLRGASSFDETTLAGSSGAIARRVSLDLNHQLLRNLALGASVGYTRSIYDGIGRHDEVADAGLRAEYRLNRSLALKAGYTFQRTISTTIGQSSTSNVWIVGVRADL